MDRRDIPGEQPPPPRSRRSWARAGRRHEPPASAAGRHAVRDRGRSGSPTCRRASRRGSCTSASDHAAVPRPHRRHRSFRAIGQLGHRAQPRGTGRCRTTRRRAQGRQVARTAPRRADPDQGQHRHRRPDAHERRVAGAGRHARARRRLRGAAPPRRRRDHPGQDQSAASGPTFARSHSTSGWSGRGGQTRNPYVLDRNPCGSSSGTGAAISANLRGARRRHGDGRLGGLPQHRQRPRRAQADGRSREPHRASSRSRRARIPPAP